MAEHKVDVIYHPTRIEVDDTDPTYLKHRGTVEVTGVSYIIEPSGRLSFRIETDKPQYKLHKDACEMTKDIRPARTLVLVTTSEVHKGDVFDIYGIVDPYLVAELYERYPDTDANTVFFYWLLKSRKFEPSATPLIDLEHLPVECPICGFPLLFTDSGMGYCQNPTCDIFRFRDLSRFISLGLRFPCFPGSMLSELIRQGIFAIPSDLYDPEGRKHGLRLLQRYNAPTKPLQQLFNHMDTMVGRVRFSDYLMSLPFSKDFACVDCPTLVGCSRYLCPPAIDRKFGSTPMDFVRMIQNVTDDFLLIENYSHFKDRVASSVQPYMSFTVYHDIARIFTDIDSDTDPSTYVDTVQDLSSLGIFQR